MPRDSAAAKDQHELARQGVFLASRFRHHGPHRIRQASSNPLPEPGPWLGQAGYSNWVAEAETGRVDSWIWSVRLVKTRSAASGACRAGHVRVNGTRVKPAHPVRAGDEVRVRQEDRDRIVEVVRVISKRVSAPVAAECYADHSPPPPPRDRSVPMASRDRGAGRPTKRDRRILDQLRGR